ncbi:MULTISPECIES: ABC transporter ATP-binding protein [unclassified Hyphomicrobium]|uniref:ABC transporter ATP-binding protein n=1 Tax=unclassified Hyphomicrobium TaxID=2619925 RepID=UPI000213E879|nr:MULTISPECIES: ABC transporter ATP-binding protein [unclassified Hyphomicrobium]CCB64028.1 Nitrate transport ATP-binding protein nrtD [Hyphomicrobium sp. MC1]
MAPAPYLVFDGIAKYFGDLEVVAPTFDLTVRRNEFIVFLGPSGSGKTTLMRMVGGLETPSTGEIRLDGQPIREPDRDRGMVFQSYSSFPWLTVAENVAYGMKYRLDMTPERKATRLAHYLQLVGLSDFADAYPNKVSGGMRQRIAIARTLAAGSDVLLMDEPFGALDAQRREDLQIELRRIQQQDAKTIIFVTHDVDEAVFLADRIIVFSKRPARMLEEVDIAAALGPDRTLELRDSERFFKLRTEVLKFVRAAAGHDN